MESILDSAYYRVTKRGLQCIGQWPFQSSREKRYFRYWTLFNIMSLLIPTMIKCMDSLDDIDIVVECLLAVSTCALSLTKFLNLTIMEGNMRRLLLIIEKDWQSLTFQCDIDILHEYTKRAQKFSFFLTILTATTIGLYLCTPVVPKILDFLHPLNETRPRVFLDQAEYFIDQDKYYKPLLLHVCIALPVTIVPLVAFETFFATFVTHACGRFEILKRYLETIHADETISVGINSLDYLELIKNRIKMCSDLQTQTLQFVQLVERSHSTALLLVVGVSMWLILVTGTMVMINISKPDEMFSILVICLDTIFHLFCSSYFGHTLVVQGERVFDAVYQSNWYSLPHRLQLMLIPIMMRSLNPCELTAGKIYIVSMRGFGAAMRTGMSFFTFFNSMRSRDSQ